MNAQSTGKEKNEEINKAAQAILNYSRKQLLQTVPEFLPIIWLMPDEAVEEEGRLFTNGEKLFYHPRTVLADYAANKERVMRQLLHILLHGLMGHFHKRVGQEDALFDAIADLKVEEAVGEVTSSWPMPAVVLENWDLLSGLCDKSLESCYLSFCDQEEDARQLTQILQSLEVDDHTRWNHRTQGESGGAGEPDSFESATKEMWLGAALQVREQMGKNPMWGALSGELSELYREVEESGVSYKEFLERFYVCAERQIVDPDSINRIWYHVGLNQTGDIPFVEPDELKEDAKELKLAIALDTSGSCCGSVMEEFLGELLALMRDGDAPDMTFCLIQCDAEVNEVRKISCEDTAKEIADGFTMMGGGGTDFRPVFDYLNELQESGEESFLGLLYLSDGYGSFPDSPPTYPTAFLFPKGEWSDYCKPPVPDWVTKVKITQDNKLEIDKENER